jgi:hypothetical protein
MLSTNTVGRFSKIAAGRSVPGRSRVDTFERCVVTSSKFSHGNFLEPFNNIIAAILGGGGKQQETRVSYDVVTCVM